MAAYLWLVEGVSEQQLVDQYKSGTAMATEANTHSLPMTELTSHISQLP